MKHSFERWREFLLNIFSKGEGFIRSMMLLHELFTGLICFEEKNVNLLTKNEGNFSLSEIFDFAIKRVCCKWQNCFSAKSFIDEEFLPLRYMDERFILEDIKILLFC